VIAPDMEMRRNVGEARRGRMDLSIEEIPNWSSPDGSTTFTSGTLSSLETVTSTSRRVAATVPSAKQSE